MKHVLIYEDFIKSYDDRISLEDFKKIQKGDIVVYRGQRCEVEESGDVLVCKVINSDKTIRVNYNMFNTGGAIPDKKKD